MRHLRTALALALAACGTSDAPSTGIDARDASAPDATTSDAGVAPTADGAAAADAATDSAWGSLDGSAGRCPKPDASAAYGIDFATAIVENPLSAGGVWTNNSQGTGGNLAPGILTSMRVDLASDNQTRIAFDTHGGVEYDDSFAFVPGFPGDQFVEAVIYKEPGYNPNANNSNHELEFILGCSSTTGSRTWNEVLFNAGGGVDILYLSGGASSFTSISNQQGASAIPKDGDVLRATKVGNQIKLYLNGAFWVGYDGSNPSMVAQGSGIGIAGFIRPGAVHNKYGFRCVTMGRL